MALRKEEITRKLLHLFALVMPAGIYYIPGLNLPFKYLQWIPMTILGSVLASSMVIEWLRFRNETVQKFFYMCFGSLLRSEEKHKTTGSTFVIGAALLCSILFIHKPYISMIVLTLFILGDAIAAIVGLSIGKIKIGKKSLEGSAACFILCMVLLYTVIPNLPGVLTVWEGRIPLLMALAISLSVTLLELIPLRVTKNLTINDNLAVPVLTGYVIIGMEMLLKLN